MDWTKENAKNYITIENALIEFKKGLLSVNDIKEVINETIDMIIERSGHDIKSIHAYRDFLKIINNENN